jgi:Ca-activated chloride channel family protein
MKTLATLIFLLALLTDPTKIGKINSLKSEAKKAYLAGDYKTAIQKYRYLVDSLQVQEDEVLLNLANSYFQLNDTTNAAGEYQSLTQSSKNQLRSKAQQQLGVMTNKQGKSEEALNHFKQAIKSDPANKDARYNYELLKKKLEEQKKQEQQKQDQNKDQNKDQENKDQQKKDQQDKQNKEQKKEQDKNKEEQNKDQQQKDQEQKDSEQKKKEQEKQEQTKEQKEDQEKKEQQNFDPEKMQQMKLSEEKAKMILEAMKNQEKQYLQQNKRKATKPKDKGKPDW